MLEQVFGFLPATSWDSSDDKMGMPHPNTFWGEKKRKLENTSMLVHSEVRPIVFNLSYS